MIRSAAFLCATASIGLLLSSGADAQTRHRHLRHVVVEEGRQITVHAPESYLTLGTGASFGDFNKYALDTVSGVQGRMPEIDHTMQGLRGQNRLPNNFTVPGCCLP